jgi:hypothetical protein
MIPVETILGIGGEIKESGGRVNSSMMYLVHCKNLCKCHNVPSPSTIKGKKFLKVPYSQLSIII